MKKAANYLAFVLILLGFAALLIKPNPPGPGPVKGLRVVFVYESSQSLPAGQQAAFDSLANRRLEGEPLQYLEGTVPFGRKASFLGGLSCLPFAGASDYPCPFCCWEPPVFQAMKKPKK